jgi:RNA polymerase sigma-70 factor, ECF subfamily
MATVEKLKLPPQFDDAVRSMEREIMRYLVRSTGNREDALDLFQETWLRAYRAYPTLKSEDGLRPWIFRIASNLCRNRVRDKTRRRRVIEDELEDADVFSELSSFEARGGQDGVLHLKREIAKLPGKQGKALVMRKFAGLDYAEIGAALDCSVESARASVYLALKKLKTDGERR